MPIVEAYHIHKRMQQDAPGKWSNGLVITELPRGAKTMKDNRVMSLHEYVFQEAEALARETNVEEVEVRKVIARFRVVPQMVVESSEDRKWLGIET